MEPSALSPLRGFGFFAFLVTMGLRPRLHAVTASRFAVESPISDLKFHITNFISQISVLNFHFSSLRFHLDQAMMCEETFGVECRHATRSGRGDRLSVIVI